MNKLFHSIETFKKTQGEQKTNEYNITTPPNFSESLNHPFLRLFPGFLKPLLLILLGGLFLLTACSEDDPTAPTSKTLSFNLQGVIAEGALVKDASVSVYLSGADSSLDSTTSDGQGRYSFFLQGIAPNTLSLRIQASYSKAGETITLRSYADIRAVTSSQSEQLTANVNEITEFAFSLASVQTEIDEEALDTLNRIIDRVSDLLNLGDNLDFRTSPHDRNLDSYQELLKFQENTEDPSKIDILRKDNGSSLTRFDKTLFMNPEPPEGIETTKNEFLNSGITEYIERVKTLPIPILANGAPEEVSNLEAEPGNKQITLTWSDPSEDFDHLEINWMPAQGDPSPPKEVSKGDETLTITGLLSETDYVFRVSAFDSDGNNSAGVIISQMPLPDKSPVIDSIDPNPVSVRAGESTQVTVSASDPDGAIPTITLGGNTPAFVALTDNRNGSASIDIMPLEVEPPARHTLIIQASSEGKTVTQDLILKITAPDMSPVINSIDPNPVSVRAGESIQVTVSASDPDGAIPTITLGENTPAFVILTNTGDGSASIDISPLEAEPPARHTLIIQASSEGKTVTQDLILNITAPDKSPVIDSIDPNPVSVRAGESIQVTVSASDPDGTVPTITLGGNTPAFVILTNTGDGSASIDISPLEAEPPARHTLIIQASSEGKTVTQDLILNITAPDKSPVINSIDPNPVSVRAGESIEVTVSASDPDGTVPTITLGGNTPAFVALTDNRDGSASIDIMPLEAEPLARHTLIIQASSEGKTVTQDLILNITAPDMSPVIDSIDPNPVSVRAGESIEVTVSASDPDGTIPTITLGGNTPAFVALTDNRDGSASIDIMPLEAEPLARHTLIIQASSEGKTVTQDLILKITAPDKSPVINSIDPNPVSVRAGESIQVTVSASDPDGTIPTITLGGNIPAFVALTDNRNGSASIDIMPLEAEPLARHTLIIQASSEGKTVTQDLILNITAPDKSPVIDSIDPNPVSVRAGESIEVTVSASDPDGTIPTITLGGNTPAFVALTDNRDGSASIDISPLEAEPPARHTLIIQASSEGKTVTQDLILNITPPLLTLGTDETRRLSSGSDFYPVTLSAGTPYIFELDVPAGVNFDLYLLNTDGNQVRSSTSSSTGDDEAFSYIPSTSGTFTVEVRRDSGSGTYTLRANQIRTLTLGTDETHNLSSGSDYYNVTLSAGTPYAFELDVPPFPANFDLYLFDADSNQVRSSISLFPEDDEAFSYIPSTSGTFTVEVRRDSGSGTYTLRANQITTLTLGTDEIHNLSSGSDFYSVTLSADTPYRFELDVPSSANFNLYLFDADGNQVRSSRNSTGADEAFSYTPSTSGTFLVEVRRFFGSGTYTLSANRITTILTLGTNETHSLSRGSDFYLVTLSADTPYRFELVVPGSVNFDLYLFDADGNQVRSSRISSGGADEAFFYTPTTSEIFIVQVQRRSGSGTYTLMANQVMPRTLTLVTNETHSLSRGSDFYLVTLSAGTPYRFELVVPGSVNFDLYLFDADGNQVRSSGISSGGADEEFSYIPSASETFTVQVQRRSGSGTYTLRANQVMPRTLTLGSDETHNLSSGSDFYLVTLSAGISYEFELDGPSGADFDLYLFDADGNEVKTSILAHSDEDFFYTPTASGIFLVEVLRFSGSGTYTLRGASETP